VKRSRALDSMVLPLSHSFGGSLAFTSFSTTVCFAGGGADSLTYSSDDSAELSVELPATISMSPRSCVDSRSPVATSTISIPSTPFAGCGYLCGGANGDHAESVVDSCCLCGSNGDRTESAVNCCVCGASGDRAESVDCFPGPGVAGSSTPLAADCRLGGAGEFTTLVFSVGAGEGGCVMDGVTACECDLSGAGEPGGCVTIDDAGVTLLKTLWSIGCKVISRIGQSS
jgi:hypothetical protein